MVTTLLVMIWYDGAREVGGAPVPDDYNTTSPPIGAFAFIQGYGVGAGPTGKPWLHYAMMRGR